VPRMTGAIDNRWVFFLPEMFDYCHRIDRTEKDAMQGLVAGEGQCSDPDSRADLRAF